MNIHSEMLLVLQILAVYITIAVMLILIARLRFILYFKLPMIISTLITVSTLLIFCYDQLHKNIHFPIIMFSIYEIGMVDPIVFSLCMRANYNRMHHYQNTANNMSYYGTVTNSWPPSPYSNDYISTSHPEIKSPLDLPKMFQKLIVSLTGIGLIAIITEIVITKLFGSYTFVDLLGMLPYMMRSDFVISTHTFPLILILFSIIPLPILHAYVNKD